METSLTTATWFWLAIPMPLCVLLSLISYLRHRATHSTGSADRS